MIEEINIKEKKDNENQMQKNLFVGGSLDKIQNAIKDIYKKIDDLYKKIEGK